MTATTRIGQPVRDIVPTYLTLTKGNDMTTVCDDPMAELAEMARRQQAEKDALAALSAAKVRIVTGRAVKFDERNVHEKRKAMGVSAFFGSGVRRTQYVPDWTIDTACTNGKVTRYNPAYVAGNSLENTVGLLAEEACHDLFSHHARFAVLKQQYGDKFNAKLSNACADMAILGLLKDAGFDIPASCCLPGSPPFEKCPPGLSLEQYYNMLHEDYEQQGGEQGGDGEDGLPDGRGQVEAPDGTSPAAIQQAEQQAKQALAQAYQEAHQRGELPAGMDQFIGELLTAKVDWRNVVREFLTANAKVDTSWATPSRKWLAQGHYLPSLSGQSLGHVVWLNDCSGSLDNQHWRDVFRSEATAVMEACPPSKITIMHHDVAVHRTDVWEPGDGELPWHPVGGGGTSHIPSFEAIAKLETPPDLVICTTDLCSSFPQTGPDCPVLWASTEDLPIPFGRKVLIMD